MDRCVNQMKAECKSPSFWRDVGAEFLATFFLVSVQCALPLTWGNANLGHAVQVALGMGFVVCAIGWSLGDFGGAHMNPAVTFAMMLTCKVTLLRGVVYVFVQTIGGVAAAGFVYGVTPKGRRESLAATTLGPDVESWQGFLIEAWITCILVITVFGATNCQRKASLQIPTVPIGFAVALGIMTAFGSTGGSMNPARSFGPAVVMDIWDDHWVYWVGPLLGGALAAFFYVLVFDRVGRKQEHLNDDDGKGAGLSNSVAPIS